MQSLTFKFTESSRVSADELAALFSRAKAQKDRFAYARKDVLYSTDEAFMHTPFDDVSYSLMCSLVHHKLALNPCLVLLIGIGGSNLGALAVHQALKGTFSNNVNPDVSFYCADTIDDDQLKDLLQIVEGTLLSGKTIMIVVVSKSGATIETLVNATIFINLLKKYRPQEYQQYIVYISDENSPLSHAAALHGIDHLSIPQKVGGRFSVFTAAGLFPLALAGVDVSALRQGAHAFLEDDPLLSACLLYYHMHHGKKIHDLFLFSPRLALLGAWYRQLMAESLGKNVDKNEAPIQTGMVPTVSIGTTDLHSMTQLALAGPRIIYTTFVVQALEQISLTVHKCPEVPIEETVTGRSVDTLKHVILHGTQRAYIRQKRPFTTLELRTIDAQSIGAFLSFKMIEIAYVGFLLNINTYDQPEVELYKTEVRNILEHE